MAFVTLEVPPEYGLVLLAATGSLFVSTWLGMRIGGFRKAAGVPYPHQYASQEQIAQTADASKKQALHLFNCAQRGHYNFLENHTPFLFALLVAGVRKPVAAAVMGGLWSVARIMYAVGYTNPDKQNGKGRLIGSWSTLIQIILYGMAGWDAYKML
ncbi:putative microsomal glutathione s-transferase protein [Neofusicoccum parvum UCRNP2]|uniref:Glutation s-transferase n=2 Tax=Neofusicoccum parvum TaxID=310453 RepID=A0ACB5SG67_9PEZI|nr:putative microsomal glutathione s-transferase protein [Neofusicoccum parvum UCRNP2]GME39510.1 Glutation s-transferase [Neofusicoccum parvum]